MCRDKHANRVLLCKNVGRGILDAPRTGAQCGVVEENRMEKLPERKHPRLKGYDYNQKGGYFITFCVKGRHELLGQVVGRGILDAPCMELSEHGINLCNAIDYLNRNNASIAIDKYIVMPNHVHIIVIVRGTSGKPRPTNATIPKLISSIKRYTNKLAGFNIWQTSYHDHVIRDDADYRRIWQYIDNNPANWDEDRYHN